MMILTLEQFTDAIEKLKETEDKNSKFSNMMQKLSDSWFCSELAYPATEALIKLLEIIFEDEETGWIAWWIYEKDYGRRKYLTARDKDDNISPSTTIEDLYNILTKKERKCICGN